MPLHYYYVLLLLCLFNLQATDPMLYLLISCVSFILISKSLTNKQSWDKGTLKLLSIGFLVASWFQKTKLHTGFFQPIAIRLKRLMMMIMALASPSEVVVENADENQEIQDGVCLFDLPELTLECILEKLSPSELCRMSGVCSSMRERCRSDHFWDRHMKQKWDKLMGTAAHREWKIQHVATTSISRRRRMGFSDDQRKIKGSLFESLSGSLPFSWVISSILQSCRVKTTTSTNTTTLPVDSVMSLYLSLESGNFWFPAQVYNRENGNVGFMLSCYDAQVSYDSGTDKFQARYSSYGRRTVEEQIWWDRIRAPPLDTPPHMLHVSDCLHDLKPGDHIEIQWRRSKEFPYGWWYGAVGHIEFCDRSQNHCHCHCNDMVVLEFSQYSPGSRWRRMLIKRKDHREEGNEADGFYGGIRKLYNVEEIAKWKRLWPSEILE